MNKKLTILAVVAMVTALISLGGGQAFAGGRSAVARTDRQIHRQLTSLQPENQGGKPLCAVERTCPAGRVDRNRGTPLVRRVYWSGRNAHAVESDRQTFRS